MCRYIQQDITHLFGLDFFFYDQNESVCTDVDETMQQGIGDSKSTSVILFPNSLCFKMSSETRSSTDNSGHKNGMEFIFS